MGSPKSKAYFLIRLSHEIQATNAILRQILGFICSPAYLFVSEQPKQTSPGTCLIPLCSLGWNIDPGEEMCALCAWGCEDEHACRNAEMRPARRSSSSPVPPRSTFPPPLSDSMLRETHVLPLLSNPAIIFWLMEDVLTKVDIKWN